MVKKKTKSREEIAMSTIDEEFQGESDRIVAIVGGAYLDELLTSLLRSVFIREEDAEVLLSEIGPLGSNGSRCKLAYCLGLIRKHQRDDLAIVAKIRNKFAHVHTSLTFDDVPISDLCKNLKQAHSWTHCVLLRRVITWFRLMVQ
jgi:DNA-binding MltR family transcriptional regulator